MRHGSLYFKVIKQNCGDIGMFRVKPSQSVSDEFKAFLSRHFEMECSAILLGGEWFIVEPIFINVQRVQCSQEDFIKRYPWVSE